MSSPCCRRSSSPTLSIGSRRARLLTSSAALRSPQTCFRLPHCLGCFAACGFPRPPALRDADYRLPPVIVLPLLSRMLLSVVVVFCDCPASASVVILYVAVVLMLLYHIRRQAAYPLYHLLVLLLLRILSLLMIPAFGEILRQWDAKVSAGPPLSGTHYGLQRQCSAEEGKRSAAVGKSAYGRHTHLAGSNMLLYVGGAAAEEQDNNGRRYARQSRLTPPQTRILYAPTPEGR